MNKKVILIIEDEKPLLNAMEKKMEDHGYEVFKATNGEEGLKLVNKEKIDLILLDLILPKIPGEQILKDMNETGLIKKVPVVVVSNKADEANALNCLKTWHATDYLIKSDNTLEKIIEKVNKILK
jgi:DNA-binding response OmpR family regulator